MRATEPVTAEGIRSTPDALVLVLRDQEKSVPWAMCSARLAAATEQERARAVLSPSGYGIHWPLIDEDLSVAGLLHSA